MAGRRKTGLLASGILLLVLGMVAPLRAQKTSGSLAGRITDLHSRPLDGALLTLHNRTTGEEVRTTAGRNGSYSFASLGPGEYSLEAASTGLGHGHLDGIVIVAGHEARVQAAMAFVPEPPTSAPVPVPQAAAVVARTVYPASPQALAVPTVTSSTPQRFAPPVRTVEPALASQTAPMEHIDAVTLGIPAMPIAAHPADLIADQQPAREVLRFAMRSTPPELTANRNQSVELAIIAAPPVRLPLRPVLFGAVAPLLHNAAPQLIRMAAISAHAALRDAAREALVTAARQSDDIASDATAITLSAVELDALPLNGGNWESVAIDVRNAAPDDSDVEGTASREFPARIFVDGMDTRLAFGARTSGRTQGRSASLIGPGSTDAALREVQSATGFSAAGRGTGSRTRVETARGGDSLHGQASIFTRQGVWGAQNPFAEWTREVAPATSTSTPQFAGRPLTPDDREFFWNASAGGRIGLTRLRWFASVDNHERNFPGVSTVRQPEDFFAQPSNDSMQVLAARLQLSPVNPVGEGIAAYSEMLETLAGLLGPARRTLSRWTGFGRLDGALGQRSRFSVEGTGAMRDAPGGGLSRAAESYGTHSYGSSHTSEQWIMARWESLLAPNFIAVTQAAYGHHELSHVSEPPSAFEQSLNINSWGRLPQMVVDSRYGFTIGNPARFGPGSYPDEHMYKAQEQVAWTHRTLELRAGFELSHNTDTTSFLRNQTGTYYYSRVENFISDVLSFRAFGLGSSNLPGSQHNCDAAGKAWHDSAGQLRGIGTLPCYSHYTQTVGPAEWWLRTNDWGGYVAASWHPSRQLTLSLAGRWDLQQVPPPLARLANLDLPLAGRLPSFGSEWGPRAGLAWSPGGRNAPVLRFGYGLYFSRTPNATLQTALTQTGSSKGDLKYFLRATDDLNAGGAPPFPYVLAGQPAAGARPEAVEFGAGFRNGQIHQAVASVEQTLPGRIHVEAAVAAALARRLPLLLDANIDTDANPRTITYNVVDGNGTGPLKSAQITVPFYAAWPASGGTVGRINPSFQQIGEAFSRANSTYESAVLRISRAGRGGLMLHARYTYAHTMDWNPDDSITFARPSVLDPTDMSQEYGTSDLDVRHAATLAVVWQPRWRLRAWPGLMVNGWRFSGSGTYRGGLPYTMRTSGSLPKEFNLSGTPIVGLSNGMSGYGGDNRVYGVGRNTFRYPATWKADMRVAKRFRLGEMRELEILAESFNFFNHQNVTQLETVGYTIDSGTPSGGLPSLHYLTGLKTGQTEFGQPLDVNATDYLHPRQIELGLRVRF